MTYTKEMMDRRIALRNIGVAMAGLLVAVPITENIGKKVVESREAPYLISDDQGNLHHFASKKESFALQTIDETLETDLDENGISPDHLVLDRNYGITVDGKDIFTQDMITSQFVKTVRTIKAQWSTPQNGRFDFGDGGEFYPNDIRLVTITGDISGNAFVALGSELAPGNVIDCRPDMGFVVMDNNESQIKRVYGVLVGSDEEPRKPIINPKNPLVVYVFDRDAKSDKLRRSI